jgi:hypothetical protein
MAANRGSEVARKVLDKLKKNKIALIVLLAGVLLLLIPFGGGSDSKVSDSGSNLTADFSLKKRRKELKPHCPKSTGRQSDGGADAENEHASAGGQDEDSSEKRAATGRRNPKATAALRQSSCQATKKMPSPCSTSIRNTWVLLSLRRGGSPEVKCT